MCKCETVYVQVSGWLATISLTSGNRTPPWSQPCKQHTHLHPFSCREVVVALRVLTARNASVTLRAKTNTLITYTVHTHLLPHLQVSLAMNMLIHLYTIYIHIPSIPSTDIIIPNIPLSVIIETLGEDGLHILG